MNRDDSASASASAHYEGLGAPSSSHDDFLQLASMVMKAEVLMIVLPLETAGPACPAVHATLQSEPLAILTQADVETNVKEFWCGTPIYSRGVSVGALLVMSEPGRAYPDAEEIKSLHLLAGTAANLIEGETARAKAQEKRRMLEMIEEMSGVCWWRVDPHASTLECSSQMSLLHGGNGVERHMSFEKALEVYPPQAQEQIRASNVQTMETGSGRRIHAEINPPGLGKRVVVSQSGCERDRFGRPTAIFGVLQDITDRERTLQQLRRNEARYRLLAENTSDVITRVKIDGSSKYISPAIKQLLGWSVEEMTGRALDYVHPDDRPTAIKALLKALQSSDTTILVNRAIHRGGHYVWCECTAKALKDENGNATEVVVVIRDITQRKALEMELTEAKESAEKATRAKSDFLANMSHELRTPLTSVIGYSGLLKGALDMHPTYRMYAERIDTASNALLQVINDILDYSKLEAHAVELEKSPFELRARLCETVDIIERQVHAKGLSLDVHIDHRVPEILSGDHSRLRQVTLNFLSNAVKFTNKGGISVNCYGAETLDGRYRLRVEVKDTGIGVGPEKGDSIFGRFTQADASTTRVYGGTGLGLAISRRLIELMGGEIGYDSVPGEGATFWYEVPLDFDFALPTSVAVDTAPEIGFGGRILMVDDAEANRELVSIILGTLGLEVETASDGVQAVEAVRQKDFDLVLMDVHMPQMDGLAATRAIRAMSRGESLPILALTANVGGEQVQKCLDAGMNGHLPKPIQVAELAQTLRKWLA